MSPQVEELTKGAKPEQAGLQLWGVTCRVGQGRYLLRPGKLFRLVHGCLAVVQLLFPEIDIVAYFLSGHYHLLVTTPDVPRLAGFMNHLKSNLAREANRLHGGALAFGIGDTTRHW